MAILNYILSFTIILSSVVKTADLFYKSDKTLNKIQKKFIDQTRSLNNNQKGSISLSAAALISIIAVLLLFYITKMQIEFKEAVYRKDSYLCFKYLNVKTSNYINEMAKFNISLRAAYLARDTIISGVAGTIIFNGLTIARNAKHLIYLKNLAKNKYCKISDARSFLLNMPFLVNKTMALETNIDETTTLRQNQWSYQLYKVPNGIRLKKSFCLESVFVVQNSFLPNLDYKTKELINGDLLNLKCLSGYSS